MRASELAFDNLVRKPLISLRGTVAVAILFSFAETGG